MNIMNYENLTVVKLKQIAKEKEIKGAYKMKKAENQVHNCQKARQLLKNNGSMKNLVWVAAV